MDAKDVAFTVLAVFSSIMLVNKWLSLYGNEDMSVVFFAALLTFSFSALIIKTK